tara:strand:+ start:170 stop:526 length:357 start_codon:yes stop_codon:yes gene_type:complete
MKNKKRILCFDIDGVICSTKKNNYKLAIPILENIKFINYLSKSFKIIIFTARYMGRNAENVIKAKKQGYKFTSNQLAKWGVKYHKLIFGKPSFDIYVDDKNLGFKKKWIRQLKLKIRK